MPRPPGSREIEHVRLRAGAVERVRDPVVIEEPLEIRLDGEPVAVTMRTPGHDVDLAFGFLFTENVVGDPDDVVAIAHCDELGNVIDVRTAPDARSVNPPERRHFFASSSCGVCGKATLDAVRTYAPDLSGDATRVAPATLLEIAASLRERQPLFRETGSLHAAALFDASGAPICVREDVGRHNAVDKVVGAALADGRVPLGGHVLFVSGRCGFEIVQKSIVAGIPVLAAVSGPSSLAVDLAREHRQTLVGFVRGDSMNVYAGEARVRPPRAPKGKER